MTGKHRTEVLQRVLEVIAEYPDGIAITPLLGALEGLGEVEVSRRTLQRWVAVLVDSGKLAAAGEGPARKYFRTQPPTEVSGDRLEEIAEDEPSGTDTLQLITRPLRDRPPVGYHPEFLLDYEPGGTWYLSAGQREYLHGIGRTHADLEAAGTFARDILDRLLIDLSWASSHLEGNTYSILDTRNLLEFGQKATGKDAEETQMILNHRHAIELLVAQADSIGFNQFTIRNIHAVLAENLLPDASDEGRLRARAVAIGASNYLPLAVPQLIEEYFERLLATANAIPDPFEQCLFVLVQIPYLQPFVDVNKRVSRIAANIPLIRHNLSPLSFLGVDPPEYVTALLAVYELNRIDLFRDLFIRAYEQSTLRYRVVRDSVAQPDPTRFRYREQIAEVLRAIIRSGEPPRQGAIEALTPRIVDADDSGRFVQLTFSELLNLHEGSIFRYQISLEDFRAWREKWKPA